MRRGDAGLERAAPAADTGWDEPDNAIDGCCYYFAVSSALGDELTAQLCQARHGPRRRRVTACPGAPTVTTESGAGALPWAEEGQAQGYLAEQRVDPCTRIPSPLSKRKDSPGAI